MRAGGPAVWCMEVGTSLANSDGMATPDNDSQNPLANEPAGTSADESSARTRDAEAENRATHGQSLAKGDTGGGSTGVPPDAQGISNRPGDSAEDDRDA